MIKRIKFKAGASPSTEALSIDVARVTILLGPNNGGKSRALEEIELWCRKPRASGGKIIDSVEFVPLGATEIDEELEKFRRNPNQGENVPPGHVPFAKLNPQNNGISTLTIDRMALIAQASAGTAEGHYVQFISQFTQRLDGKARLNLVADQAAGNLQFPPSNHLAKLFLDNRLRADVRRIVHRAFGKYLVVDPTNIGQLQLKFSDREPKTEQEERGWDQQAISFHANAVPLLQASDGVRAFVGLLTSILAGDPRIVMIDEPEAFLHPSLANQLGKEVALSLIGNEKKRLIAATHSPTFLMGCIQAGVELNIVRLTYNYEAPTARVLPKDKILHLMRNPLLRSTGVLSALFYESVVVTEADADRAFYQEVNERLLSTGDARGVQNCLFLNAKNKQTVWDIVKPLRELGIPAVGVVDIDVLKEGGQVWQKPLDGAFIPHLSHSGLQASRAAIFEAFAKSGKDMKRDGGIQALSSSDREACKSLLDNLQEYGVFVVPSGELESWLPNLKVARTKNSWLLEIFEKMGEDPAGPDYVRPEVGDVWDFLGSIKKWVTNPCRRGIPA